MACPRTMLALMLATLVAASPLTASATSSNIRRHVPRAKSVKQPERTGRVSGVARDEKNRALPFFRIRLRNTDTGQQVSETKSDKNGQFVFTGLNPGTYVVEIVDATGHVLGTATVHLSTTMVVSGVTVTATAAATAAAAAGGAVGAAAAGGGFFSSTGGIVLLASAGLGFGALIVVKTTASPSR